MSRYTFMGHKPNHSIVVGWDRPLETYFAQVWDGGALEAGDLVLWTGANRREVPTVGALSKHLAPFAVLPSHVRETLKAEEEFDFWFRD